MCVCVCASTYVCVLICTCEDMCGGACALVCACMFALHMCVLECVCVHMCTREDPRLMSTATLPPLFFHVIHSGRASQANLELAGRASFASQLAWMTPVPAFPDRNYRYAAVPAPHLCWSRGSELWFPCLSSTCSESFPQLFLFGIKRQVFLLPLTPSIPVQSHQSHFLPHIVLQTFWCFACLPAFLSFLLSFIYFSNIYGFVQRNSIHLECSCSSHT